MPGLGRRTWTAGEVVTASNVQSYLQDQSVMVFASAAARSSALGTAVSTGMVSYRTDGTAVEYYNGSAWVALGTGSGDVTTTGVQTLYNKTLASPREVTTVGALTVAGTVNFDVATQADLFSTSNASAPFTLNIRGNSILSLNSLMAVGATQTIVFRNTNGATAYYMTALTIDGAAQTIKWQGGTAPAAGNVNSIDVYSFVITKTASATYTVLGSLTKFA
jgi:hypothetical protein